MTDADFYRAILTEPEDDAPRLVFADWLEENGDEVQRARAAFIRAQVEAERVSPISLGRRNPGTQADPRRAVLDSTAGRLWREYRVAWFGPGTTVLPASVCQRGFLADTSDSAWASLVRAARREEDAWPLGPVALLHVTTRTKMAHWPGLASWGGLRLSHDSDVLAKQARTYLASPHLTSLVTFEAVRAKVGNGGVAALANAPGGFRLRSLTLDCCGVTNEGVRRLAHDPAFGDLRRLTLCESAGPDAVAELLSSPNLANLHSLFFTSLDNPSSTPCQALLQSPHLSRLRSLTLAFNPGHLAANGIDRFIAWPGLARLESLSFLGGVGLTADGVRTLAACPHVAGLRELRFTYLPFIAHHEEEARRFATALETLAVSPYLRRLRKLEVDDRNLPAPEVDRMRATLLATFGERVQFFSSGMLS